MGMFGDDGQITDLRIVLDDAQNPSFAADATIAADASVRPVHLSHVADPRLALVVEVFVALYIPAEIAAPDIAEIPERPDSIHHPISRSQAVAGQQFVLFLHGRRS
jgi:hypothetical protein